MSRKAIGYCVEYGAHKKISGIIISTLEEQKSRLRSYAREQDLTLDISDEEDRSGGSGSTGMGQRQYYIELYDNKRKFPALGEALLRCREQNAILLIAQLQNLASNERFTAKLLDPAFADVEFYCLDQPKITRETLPAVADSYRQKRLIHSARIRKGLEETTAKLGNPNALKEITKVNKPKSESAIMFALILAPIIASYRSQGFSQRKMVEALNEEGFMAPEGGLWVLSQLQKVLERIDLNNIALKLVDILDEFKSKAYNEEQCIRALNAMGERAPGRGQWDEHKYAAIVERREAIFDIVSFNRFVLDMYPKFKLFQERGLTDDQIAERLNIERIKLPERVLWELRHESETGDLPEDKVSQWTSEDVERFRSIAKRRYDDIVAYIRPHTLDRSEDLLAETAA